jgi:hypothetical protein
MNANAATTKEEPPPEFAETFSTFYPAQDSAQPATLPAVERSQAVTGSKTSQPDLASDATESASSRRGLMSGRAWIILALFLLLVVLGVITWRILAD